MAYHVISMEERQKNCPHLGARIHCDNCGAYLPTPEELTEWKKQYMTVPQLVDLLRSSLALDEEAVRRYAAAEVIPSYKLDGELLFNPMSIAKWMKGLLDLCDT